MARIGAMGGTIQGVRLKMATNIFEEPTKRIVGIKSNRKKNPTRYELPLEKGRIGLTHEENQRRILRSERPQSEFPSDKIFTLTPLSSPKENIASSSSVPEDSFSRRLHLDATQGSTSTQPSLKRNNAIRRDDSEGSVSSLSISSADYENAKSKFEQLKQKHSHLPSAHTIFSLLSALKILPTFGLPVFQK